ncbi:MAG: HDOD domain-containing protein [Aestuariibacter sp.]
MTISFTANEKAILQKITIPPRPEAIIQIGEEAKKTEPDVARIAKIIASDIGISSAVLQVVNSAAFRRNKDITSISQAVMTLGFKRILPLVKSVALKSSMGNVDKLQVYWNEANQMANATMATADVIGKNQLVDQAYMLGLFHNAGIPVMLMEFDDYPAILQLANEQGWPAVGDIERERYGTSHTTISAILAQRWKLPEVMIEVIYYQFDVDGIYSSGELSELGLDLLSVLKIARHIVKSETNYLTSETAYTQEWLQVEDGIIEQYGFSEADLYNIREQVRERLSESKS